MSFLSAVISSLSTQVSNLAAAVHLTEPRSTSHSSARTNTSSHAQGYSGALAIADDHSSDNITIAATRTDDHIAIDHESQCESDINHHGHSHGQARGNNSHDHDSSHSCSNGACEQAQQSADIISQDDALGTARQPVNDTSVETCPLSDKAIHEAAAHTKSKSEPDSESWSDYVSESVTVHASAHDASKSRDSENACDGLMCDDKDCASGEHVDMDEAASCYAAACSNGAEHKQDCADDQSIAATQYKHAAMPQAAAAKTRAMGEGSMCAAAEVSLARTKAYLDKLQSSTQWSVSGCADDAALVTTSNSFCAANVNQMGTVSQISQSQAVAAGRQPSAVGRCAAGGHSSAGTRCAEGGQLSAAGRCAAGGQSTGLGALNMPSMYAQVNTVTGQSYLAPVFSVPVMSSNRYEISALKMIRPLSINYTGRYRLYPALKDNQIAAMMMGKIDILKRIISADASSQEIAYYVDPLLLSMIRLCNVLPASESHHDNGVCGLVDHNIKCAIYALNAFKSIDPQPKSCRGQTKLKLFNNTFVRDLAASNQNTNAQDTLAVDQTVVNDDFNGTKALDDQACTQQDIDVIEMELAAIERENPAAALLIAKKSVGRPNKAKVYLEVRLHDSADRLYADIAVNNVSMMLWLSSATDGASTPLSKATTSKNRNFRVAHTIDALKEKSATGIDYDSLFASAPKPCISTDTNLTQPASLLGVIDEMTSDALDLDDDFAPNANNIPEQGLNLSTVTTAKSTETSEDNNALCDGTSEGSDATSDNDEANSREVALKKHLSSMLSSTDPSIDDGIGIDALYRRNLRLRHQLNAINHGDLKFFSGDYYCYQSTTSALKNFYYINTRKRAEKALEQSSMPSSAIRTMPKQDTVAVSAIANTSIDDSATSTSTQYVAQQAYKKATTLAKSVAIVDLSVDKKPNGKTLSSTANASIDKEVFEANALILRKAIQAGVIGNDALYSLLMPNQAPSRPIVGESSESIKSNAPDCDFLPVSGLANLASNNQRRRNTKDKNKQSKGKSPNPRAKSKTTTTNQPSRSGKKSQPSCSKVSVDEELKTSGSCDKIDLNTTCSDHGNDKQYLNNSTAKSQCESKSLLNAHKFDTLALNVKPITASDEVDEEFMPDTDHLANGLVSADAEQSSTTTANSSDDLTPSHVDTASDFAISDAHIVTQDAMSETAMAESQNEAMTQATTQSASKTDVNDAVLDAMTKSTAASDDNAAISTAASEVMTQATTASDDNAVISTAASEIMTRATAASDDNAVISTAASEVMTKATAASDDVAIRNGVAAGKVTAACCGMAAGRVNEASSGVAAARVNAASSGVAESESQKISSLMSEPAMIEYVNEIIAKSSFKHCNCCGLTISDCNRIYNESLVFYLERGCNYETFELLSVEDKLECILDDFAHYGDLYQVRALSTGIEIAHKRRSMIKTCPDSNYELTKRFDLTDEELEDLFCVLNADKIFTSGPYLLGACDDEIDFAQRLKPFSLDAMFADPAFEVCLMSKLMEDKLSIQGRKSKATIMQNKVNSIYDDMQKSSLGRFSARQQRFIAELAIIYMSFAHDLGKIRTDFDIRSANGLKYDVCDSLSQFLSDTNSPYLLVRHHIGRINSHDDIGLSYGIELLGRLCHQPHRLISQLFDLHVAASDTSNPLYFFVTKEGDARSSAQSVTNQHNNAEMLRLMAKELPLLRLRITQINAMLTLDLAHSSESIGNDLIKQLDIDNDSAALNDSFKLSEVTAAKASTSSQSKISVLTEVNRRYLANSRIASRRFDSFKRDIDTYLKLVYGSCVCEYERCIHSVNELYSDIYLSDNYVYVTTGSRARDSLLIGANLLTYSDLQTSLNWNASLLSDSLYRNGLLASKSNSYYLTKTNSSVVIFRGFGIKVENENIYEQAKVRPLDKDDSLMDAISGSLALYVAARKQQQDYLIDKRNLLLRVFELITALTDQQRRLLLNRLDEITLARFYLLEHSLNIFCSPKLINASAIAAALNIFDPLVEAIEQGPSKLQKTLERYNLAMARLTSNQSTANGASVAGVSNLNATVQNESPCTYNRAEISIATSNAALPKIKSDVATLRLISLADAAQDSQMEIKDNSLSDKDAWHYIASELETRMRGIDIAAVALNLSLRHKGDMSKITTPELIVLREILGGAVAILLAASHADDNLDAASTRHMVLGGFDYHKMKLRGISVCELENVHAKGFDVFKLPLAKDYALKPDRIIFNKATQSDLMQSSKHHLMEVTVCFEQRDKVIHETFDGRAARAQKLREKIQNLTA